MSTDRVADKIADIFFSRGLSSRLSEMFPDGDFVPFSLLDDDGVYKRVEEEFLGRFDGIVGLKDFDGDYSEFTDEEIYKISEEELFKVQTLTLVLRMLERGNVSSPDGGATICFDPNDTPERRAKIKDATIDLERATSSLVEVLDVCSAREIDISDFDFYELDVPGYASSSLDSEDLEPCF